jgi:hypothetical protein
MRTFRWLLLLPLFAFIPPQSFVVKARHDFFTSDHLGNLYLVHDQELLKYLPGGKLFARYSNLKRGPITSIDATNPLKIVVYYNDFQNIVFLDNQLSENSDMVDLTAIGYEQTAMVCAGANNSFWLYSKQNNELVRFSEQSKKLVSTGNLKPLLQQDLHPDYMLEHNGYLYLNSPNEGIFVFDIFGTFSKLLPLKNLHQFQVQETQLMYTNDSALCRYNPQTFETNCMELPSKGARQTRWSATYLFSDYPDSVVCRPLH